MPLRTDPLYRYLVQILPRLGIALFLYDRRGSGQSTSGGAAPGNFDLLAGDAVAALAWLRCGPGIDPKRIGFWGLSQGGWLTLLAAKMVLIGVEGGTPPESDISLRLLKKEDFGRPKIGVVRDPRQTCALVSQTPRPVTGGVPCWTPINTPGPPP